MLDALLTALTEMAWLEFTGLVSGLLCVWLLIRQNVWTFPIGLVYSAVSVAVFLDARLYADVLLSGYYVLMNGYGWYYWLKGGVRTADDELPVSHTPPRVLAGAVGLTALSTLAMGAFLATQTDAALPYWDSFTTCASFVAMWMTARKYLESWILWLIVDVVAVGVYLVKGIELYAVLYFVYLGMAVAGFRAWQRSLGTAQPLPSA